MDDYLKFEKPVADLDGKLAGLCLIAEDGKTPGVDADIDRLTKQREKLLTTLYKSLTPWHKTLVSRHPVRPRLMDYIDKLIDDFTFLCGDRSFADDHAVIGGLGWLGDESVMVIGQEKGSDTESRIHHNFGMAHPEGYRKAARLIGLASRFGVPVLTFIDTPGAYPGIGAEERGQAEAIARSTQACLNLEAPLVALVIGEGGSGGAVALATADRVLMLEHSVYTVASPEAAASILWRDAQKAEEMAAAMKITAQSLKELGIIDQIIDEPVGGAHRDYALTMERTKIALQKNLSELLQDNGPTLRRKRHEKFLALGRPLA